MNDCNDVPIRFDISEGVHQKVKRVQALFQVKEGKRTSLANTYVRVIEIGIAQIMKSNKF